MSNYVTLEEFKERHPSITGIDDDDLIDACITAASRAVDAYCARRFYADTTATARTVHVNNAAWLDVDDVSSTAGLVIATDQDDDGVFETTWTADDYFLEPINGKRGGLEGLPYDRVVSTGNRWFPTGNIRPAVQVTALWGWPSVPEAVKQATHIKTAQLYRRKDSPDGLAGAGDFGVVRISRFEDPTFAMLLAPYRAHGGSGLVVG